MTVQEALNDLNEIKKHVPSNNDKAKIIDDIDKTLDYLRRMSCDSVLAGPQYELSEEIAEQISVANSSLAQTSVDINWSAKLLASVLLSKEKENGRRQLTKIGAKSSAAVDKRHTRLIFAFGTIATLIGILVIVLLFINIEMAQFWATVLGIADFIVGIIGFCTERVSDINARRVKTEIAQITQKGIAGIEKQNTVRAVEKVTQDTRNILIKIVQQGVFNIIKIKH